MKVKFCGLQAPKAAIHGGTFHQDQKPLLRRTKAPIFGV